MNPRMLVLVSVLVGGMVASPARAHFLFIRITPPAEGGRAAEVYFSEYAEAGDPTFVDRISHTQLRQQTEPGKFQALKVRKGADRLRAYLPASSSVVVTGACEYGVVARPNAVPFLLRYYPKAVAGKADELNRMQLDKDLPFEIVASIEKDGLVFTAMRAGKPVPDAVFDTVAFNLSGEKLKAGADGKASWKPAKPGRYAVYTRHVTKTPGEAAGKHYDEIREFATCSFTWPTTVIEADARAAALFSEAVATRATWKAFPGFTAQLEGKVDGRPIKGKLTIDAEGKVTLDSEEQAAQPWVIDQLESIVLHRKEGPPRSGSRPKPVVHFGDNDGDNPLGRLVIFEGGRFASSYRIKDKQLTVVNRVMGALVMTITVLDNDRTAEGKYLPRSYIVQYWNAASGALQHTEAVQERWQRVGGIDLPSVHTVTAASETGLSVRSFTLSKHELLKSVGGK